MEVIFVLLPSPALTTAPNVPYSLPLTLLFPPAFLPQQAKAAEVAKTQGAGVNVTDTMAAFAAAARKEDRS